MIDADGDDGAQGDAAQGEGVAELQRDVTDADNDAGCHRDEVHRIAEIDVVLLPDLGAQKANHAVEDDGDAAQYPTGSRRDDGTELGGEAEQDRHDRSHHIGGRRVHPRCRHDADVLRVGRRRARTEEGGQYGGRTVSGDRPPDLMIKVLAGHLGNGLDVTGVLGDEGDDDRQGQQDEGQVEGRQVEPNDVGGRVMGSVLGLGQVLPGVQVRHRGQADPC